MPSLLDLNEIVVRQHRKFLELTNEFELLDRDGRQVGSVVQIRQSPLALLGRIGTDFDVALPMTLELRSGDAPALVLHKPWFRMTCRVQHPDGAPVGTVRKELRLGKARFVLEDADGERVGSVRAENWRARDFSVRDGNDTEVARVSKQWRGLATELLTDADSYVVRLSPDLRHPLRSLALASSLAIDTVLKQKDE